jgi:DNA-binding response OmpR family regulator
MREQFHHYFKRQGWRCEMAENENAFWRKTALYDYDALVIAAQASDKVLDWARRLRRSGAKEAMLLLATEDCTEQRINALQAGYDDVLQQPAHPGELRARLQAIWRRQADYPQEVFQLGGLRILPEAGRAEAHGKALELTNKEFSLLYYLARQRGRIVSKESIVEYLWGENREQLASYDFLYAHLKNLRRKLKEAGAGAMITTAYGRGYALQESSA